MLHYVAKSHMDAFFHNINNLTHGKLGEMPEDTLSNFKKNLLDGTYNSVLFDALNTSGFHSTDYEKTDINWAMQYILGKSSKEIVYNAFKEHQKLEPNFPITEFFKNLPDIETDLSLSHQPNYRALRVDFIDSLIDEAMKEQDRFDAGIIEEKDMTASKNLIELVNDPVCVDIISNNTMLINIFRMATHDYHESLWGQCTAPASAVRSHCRKSCDENSRGKDSWGLLPVR